MSSDPAQKPTGRPALRVVGDDDAPAGLDWAEKLIRQHQAGVWRYLRALGCAADLADDLLQETFLTAFRRGFEDRTAEQSGAYLRKTARFLFLRTRSMTRRREALLADAADFLWDRDCVTDDGDEWLEALRLCVDSVSGRGRVVLHRFYRDGASRAEVARELEMKENGVKTLLARVRKVLRECVDRRLSQ